MSSVNSGLQFQKLFCTSPPAGEKPEQPGGNNGCASARGRGRAGTCALRPRRPAARGHRKAGDAASQTRSSHAGGPPWPQAAGCCREPRPCVEYTPVGTQRRPGEATAAPGEAPGPFLHGVNLLPWRDDGGQRTGRENPQRSAWGVGNHPPPRPTRLPRHLPEGPGRSESPASLSGHLHPSHSRWNVLELTRPVLPGQVAKEQWSKPNKPKDLYCGLASPPSVCSTCRRRCRDCPRTLPAAPHGDPPGRGQLPTCREMQSPE